MSEAVLPGPLVPPRINLTYGHNPGYHLPENPKVDELCVNINTNYDIVSAAVCLLYIKFGILYIFFGYRCFKTIMFLTGFIFASSIVYLICIQGELLTFYGNTGVAIFAGLLFGLITMLVQYVGLFMTGVHTGLLLGVGLLLVADFIVETTVKGSIWLCVGVLLANALMFSILNLYFRRGLTILGTSLYGGAIFSAALDYFIEKLSMVIWLWDRVSLRPVSPPPCWFSWIILGVWPTLVLLGLVIQCTVTGRGIYHDNVIVGRKEVRGSAAHGKRGKIDRVELKQKKYRYLYQVRTAHGDIISQDFVQAIQNKDPKGGESSTMRSDSTHLTILPDAHLMVHSESEDESQSELPKRS